MKGRAPGRYDGLTVAQANLLSFIRWEAREGRTPTFEDMREYMGLASKSGAHRLVAGLADRGYVDRRPNSARAIIANDTPQATPESLKRASIDQLLGELKSRGLRVQLAGAA